MAQIRFSSIQAFSEVCMKAIRPDQIAVPLKNAPETAPYFSLILIVKGAGPWL